MIEELSCFITFMKQSFGRDISIYNDSFLLKTLTRRWIEIGVNNFSEYYRVLNNNNKEADAFYSSLNITYSQFFREGNTFSVLEQTILPAMISNKLDGSEIRIWSAGCSNGQEAYSIAILLSELAEFGGKSIKIRIFATDISEKALAIAKAGVFDQNEVQNLKFRYLNKYFVKQDKTYTILPKLKQLISFSYYDLLNLSSAYPPESIYGDFDLVMCSNLLFYYKANLQLLIIKKLQKSISSNGYLVTGEAEKSIIENATKLNISAIPVPIFKNYERR